MIRLCNQCANTPEHKSVRDYLVSHDLLGSGDIDGDLCAGCKSLLREAHFAEWSTEKAVMTATMDLLVYREDMPTVNLRHTIHSEPNTAFNLLEEMDAFVSLLNGDLPLQSSKGATRGKNTYTYGTYPNTIIFQFVLWPWYRREA